MNRTVGEIAREIQRIDDLSTMSKYTRISSKEEAQKFADEFSSSEHGLVVLVPNNDFTNLAFYAMEHCRFLEGLSVKDPRYDEKR